MNLAIKYVKGDVLYPLGNGGKLIVHVCNNRGGWGKGFVGALSRRWRKTED
jgi:O-acetyl-ADP-ribose deacetylase (regulator of RNase III)